MASVHNEPHPLAHKYVVPSNKEIAKKFGVVRVEDWDDRIAGDTWMTLRERGEPSVERYVDLVNTIRSQSPVLAPAVLNEVVRCHTQSTGEMVRLHDAWLEGAQVIA